jgi:hypothetical protein
LVFPRELKQAGCNGRATVTGEPGASLSKGQAVSLSFRL